MLETTSRSGDQISWRSLAWGRCLTVTAALVLASSCTNSKHADLEKELKQRSASEGLALVLPTGNRFMVFPFDGEPRRFISRFRMPLTVTFGKAGRMILWYGQPLIGEMIAEHSPIGDATLATVDGGTKKNLQLPPPILQFFPAALSEASGRLAFIGTTRRDGLQSTGLHWATFDFSTIGFLGHVDGYPGCDWSPDGRFLAYQNGDHIYTFDVSTGWTKQLAQGIEPNWNPDGKSIAFRALGDKASLVTTEGVPVPWPLGKYKPNGPIRWSPDGRYVAFSEHFPLHLPIFGTANRTVVMRVSDGTTVTAAEFGDFWPNYTSYHWIVDYRDFCKDCQVELPFKP